MDINFFCFSFLIPFYWFLYLGWISLLISLIAGLYCRKANTLHLYFATGLNWHESTITFNKVNGHKIDAEEEASLNKRKKKEKKYFKISNLTMKIAEIFFVAGLILIVLFVIFLANSLIGSFD